jgi:hypothetical protein
MCEHTKVNWVMSCHVFKPKTPFVIFLHAVIYVVSQMLLVLIINDIFLITWFVMCIVCYIFCWKANCMLPSQTEHASTLSVDVTWYILLILKWSVVVLPACKLACQKWELTFLWLLTSYFNYWNITQVILFSFALYFYYYLFPVTCCSPLFFAHKYLQYTPLFIALGHTQPPIQWVQGALFPGIKWPGCEADQSPPSSAKVKECMGYTSTPQYNFMAWCSSKKKKAQGQLYL